MIGVGRGRYLLMLRLSAHCRVVEVDMYVAARIKLLLLTSGAAFATAADNNGSGGVRVRVVLLLQASR